MGGLRTRRFQPLFLHLVHSSFLVALLIVSVPMPHSSDWTMDSSIHQTKAPFQRSQNAREKVWQTGDSSPISYGHTWIQLFTVNRSAAHDGAHAGPSQRLRHRHAALGRKRAFPVQSVITSIARSRRNDCALRRLQFSSLSSGSLTHAHTIPRIV